MPQPPILILPGWMNSLKGHWQTHFEETFGANRVQQTDWLMPKLADWLAELEKHLHSLDKKPILVAHSLGCVLASRLPERLQRKVEGAFLVAPPDIDREDMPKEIHDFRPNALGPLLFPALIVGSTNDPYISTTKLKQLADVWQAELVLLQDCGHINPDSGFGEWPEGERLFRQFCARLL